MKLSIATKYPIFLVMVTLLTAVIITAIVINISMNSLTEEIHKRGVAIAEGFSAANTIALLNTDSTNLQLSINNLAKNQDIKAAYLVDHRGVVVASRNPNDVGRRYKLDKESKEVVFSIHGQRVRSPFLIQVPITYSGVYLGTFVLKLSREPLRDATNAATNRVAIFVISSTVVIAILLFLLLRKMLQPIGEMRNALAKIGEGNFTQRIQLKRKDEIGDLANAFNDMTSRAELFFRYVDRTIVERLIANPKLARPGGQMKDMTVLFGDMRGYTSMSNRRTADEVIRIINTYFYLFIELVSMFDGIVDKTMGDAIMAVFERMPDDAQREYQRRAVMAAAHMKAASVVLNTFLRKRMDRQERFIQEPRDFGFALASGQAILGNIGSARRMDYSVCGRIVNLASRLEKETQRGEVIMDNFCRMALDKTVNYETLATVQPKGFSVEERVTPHRVLSIVGDDLVRMRKRLKKIFSIAFVQGYLLPESFPDNADPQAWAEDALDEIHALIDHLSQEEFFALISFDSWL